MLSNQYEVLIMFSINGFGTGIIFSIIEIIDVSCVFVTIILTGVKDACR